VSHKELYELARAGNPESIPGLLDMITLAAMEILRLEGERDIALLAPRDALVEFLAKPHIRVKLKPHSPRYPSWLTRRGGGKGFSAD
jgi:hypothetical protein